MSSSRLVPPGRTAIGGLLLALLTSMVSGARADELTIGARADTTLYEERELSNGRGSYLFAGRTRNNLLRRALIAFDVERALPAGTVITGATLHLYASRTPGGPATVSVHRVNTAWGEGTSDAPGEEGVGAPATVGDATWSERRYREVAWQNAGGDFAPEARASTLIDAVGAYAFTSDRLKEDVQAWLDHPEQNFGWMLRAETEEETTARRFNSREFLGTTRPALTIQYEKPQGSVGACCSVDGGCGIRRDASSCEGTFRGIGTSCDPNECPPPVGACCAHDARATCEQRTESACNASGHMWRGPGVACDPNPCPVMLTPFVDPLPLPPVAKPIEQVDGVDHYRMSMVQLKQKLHRDLPPTTVWGYSDGSYAGYPGPTIEARVHETVRVTWVNDLRDEQGQLRKHHVLPVETCIHGVEDDTPRTVVHLHGAHVPAESDGQPDWTLVPGEETVYEYPNHQEAATLWYHDHAMGITRLNVYMGLAGLYLLRNPEEEKLGLPSGEYEVPLVIQDRSFAPDGSLRYAEELSEHFFGDTVLVNGKVWPYLEVKRGLYRFRVLNGSGSRTYTLKVPGAGLLTVVGSDGGLLPAPVKIASLTLAPGERAEFVVDFRRFLPGQQAVLQNVEEPADAAHLGSPDVMQFRILDEPGYTADVPEQLRARQDIPEDSARLSRDFVLAKSPSDCGGSAWLINGKGFHDITERPLLGTAEIWRFINRSGTLHSMHMHLVMFQVLDRQRFELDGDEVVPIGPRMPPRPEESGWKDTVQVGPFEMARVIARFTDYAGRYAYHCHILEHEDHEMMRQFETVTSLDARPDAGVGGIDAGPQALSPYKGGGCGCGVAPSRAPTELGWLLICALWLVRRSATRSRR